MAEMCSGMLTTKQLAERLGLKRHQLVHLIESGKISDSTHRVGNRRVFTEDEAQEIERYLAARNERTAKGGTDTIDVVVMM